MQPTPVAATMPCERCKAQVSGSDSIHVHGRLVCMTCYPAEAKRGLAAGGDGGIYGQGWRNLGGNRMVLRILVRLAGIVLFLIGYFIYQALR